jgi:hypothetical protein
VSTPLQWNPAKQFYQPVLPPPPEWIAQAFLTPLLNPCPVATRLPQNLNSDEAMVNGFMRVEAGNIARIPDLAGAAWNVSFLMHAYSPNEPQAEQISCSAIGYASAATGLTVVGWYIVCVETVVGGHRLEDPLVPSNIVRYRSAVTWRVAGLAPTITTQ